MKEKMEQLKEDLESFHLGLGDLKIQYSQKNTGIDYSGDFVNFTDSEDDFIKGVETLARAFYLQNSSAGARLLSTRKGLDVMRRSVLGNLDEKLSPAENPVVYVTGSETQVFPSKESIDPKTENYEALVYEVSRPQFRFNDSVVMVNKEAPLALEYFKMAMAYNQMQNAVEPAVEAFTLFVKELMHGDHQLDGFEQEKVNLIKTDINGYQLYKKMKMVSDEIGHLTAFRVINVQNDSSDDYLKVLASESSRDESSERTAVLCDKSRRNIFILHGKADVKASATDLDGITIRKMGEDEFRREMAKGNITLNDLILEGKDLDGSGLERLRQDYSKMSFDVSLFKGDALNRITAAEKLYQDSSRLNAMRAGGRRVAESQLSAMYYSTMIQCVEALRSLVFAEIYTKDQSKRISTAAIIENPETDKEKLLSSYHKYLSAANVRGVSSQDAFRMVYEVKSMLMNEVKPEAKPEEPIIGQAIAQQKPKEDGLKAEELTTQIAEDEKPAEKPKVNLASFLAKKK